MRSIAARPLTETNFAPFGEVLDCDGDPDRIINRGLCGRWHDRALIDTDDSGRPGISLFLAEPRELPYRLDLVERHPEGSQAFLPMHEHPWLVVVAEPGDLPGPIHAFIAAPGQGVNFARGTWHGVLTPLHAPGRFAVIDRIGPGANLQEHELEEPVLITGP
ncbi:ureidoglycolate hydrolase [Roseivivax halodurans JCM 10272]|uniref:Ureidoglycolate hydrolase n=1 Tax=Roseivivax halodurans JCM 10272 TaxID=1449350 RepID=X7ECN7_9RHOB|nr:ureidoglycolate lyase [Roseivivax halodurans]ETX13844.1 ureidoglycolate hydrolase [Roseivivax halodurans JCM 10272]